MKNNSPLVSVIITNYNLAEEIAGAVESVLGQTYSNHEVIVIDDGSTDNSKEVLKPYIDRGAVKYFYKENEGPSSARNLGIKMARGEFVKFLDGDDYLYPRQLELQVAHLLDKPPLVISVTDYELEFESKNRKKIKLMLEKDHQLAKFIKGNPCPPHTILLRLSLVKQVGGFDVGQCGNEDSNLWLRILIQGGIFEKVDYAGCCYRIREGSVSAGSAKMFNDHCKLYENLNQILLQRFDKLEFVALEQLLSSNTELIHMCFARKINPVIAIPTTLKAASVLYAMEKKGVRKFIFKIIGIQNVALLQYLKACLRNKHYHSRLLNLTWWRQEKSYE